MAALQDRRLKVARLSELNDPFEGFHTDTDNYMSQFLLKERRRVANQRFGVLCFSKSHLNPVQWAHYADSHQGLCLGFEIPADDLVDVEYVSERSTLTEFMSKIDLPPGDFLRFMLSRKYAHWSYEAEVRKIVSIPIKAQDIVFRKFEGLMQLTDVIIGFRSRTTKKFIRTLVQEYAPAARIIRVCPSATKFEMVEC
jgi:hypothetical protein